MEGIQQLDVQDGRCRLRVDRADEDARLAINTPDRHERSAIRREAPILQVRGFQRDRDDVRAVGIGDHQERTLTGIAKKGEPRAVGREHRTSVVLGTGHQRTEVATWPIGDEDVAVLRQRDDAVPCQAERGRREGRPGSRTRNRPAEALLVDDEVQSDGAGDGDHDCGGAGRERHRQSREGLA